MAVKNFVFEQMTLGQLLVVLCDHYFTFEQLREMTTTQIFDAIKRINDGSIRSWQEVEAEKKAKTATGKR